MILKCCEQGCGANADFAISPANDPYFGSHACTAHLGGLIGHDPDKEAPSHYVVEVVANGD